MSGDGVSEVRGGTCEDGIHDLMTGLFSGIGGVGMYTCAQ